MHGKRLIASLLKAEGGVQKFLQMDLKHEWFVGTDLEVFSKVYYHVMNYASMPGADALHGIDLPDTTEDPAFYCDKVKAEYLHRMLTAGMQVAAESLNQSDQHEALRALQQTVLGGMKSAAGKKMMNYADQSSDVIEKNLFAIKHGLYKKVTTGWPTLDGMTGGLAAGDIVSVVGRPANGKTFLLLWAALHGWANQNITPLVFSMEMNHLAITERLAGMQSDVTLSQIKSGVLTDFKKKQLLQTLAENKGKHPFWIIDGALNSSVEDVILYSNQLKPDIVFIDGAYLLRSMKNVNRWERVTDNLERLKGEVAEALGVPVFISYQFNREGAKKHKKGEEPGLEDIGYTDAVGQISSVVLGMLEEDTIEQTKRRRVKILKGRDGQRGEFQVNWLFQPHQGLDFSEVTEKDISDLNYT